MMLTTNIIGAGKLGKTIAYLLAKKNVIRIAAVCNKTEESAMRAIRFLGEGACSSAISDLPPADLTLITTPDDLIAESCIALCQGRQFKKDSLVVHCSGTFTSDILSPAKEAGCYVASVHPMRSFADPEASTGQYPGTYCALEGDAEAVSIVRMLFTAIESKCFEISREKKALYHAAGVFASNYLLTLAEQAQSCLLEAGVEQDVAIGLVTNLMQGTLFNLEKTRSPALSLTGPVKRGDAETVKQHLDVLGANQKNLYAALGLATIPLSTASTEKKASLKEALASPCISNKAQS